MNLLPLSALAGGQVIARLMTEPRRAVFHVGSMVMWVALIVFGLFR